MRSSQVAGQVRREFRFVGAVGAFMPFDPDAVNITLVAGQIPRGYCSVIAEGAIMPFHPDAVFSCQMRV